jgi:hypothetical protein
MHNSMYVNGRKVADEVDNLKLDCVTHPPYSLDLSPCDFWPFGMLKQTSGIRFGRGHHAELSFCGTQTKLMRILIKSPVTLAFAHLIMDRLVWQFVNVQKDGSNVVSNLRPCSWAEGFDVLLCFLNSTLESTMNDERERSKCAFSELLLWVCALNSPRNATCVSKWPRSGHHTASMMRILFRNAWKVRELFWSNRV